MLETREVKVNGYTTRVAVERCANPLKHEEHVYSAAANKRDRSGHYAHCPGT